MARRQAGATWGPGAGRRLRLLVGLLPASLAGLLLILTPSAAQQPERQVKTEYFRFRDFQLPFTPDPRITRVHLYVSEDDGRTWTHKAAAQPSLGHKYFEF